MTMRLYTYFPLFDEEQNLIWRVQETMTDQGVADLFFEDDAKEYCEFLEYGGGFHGFTPAFILKRSQIGDINRAFEAEFLE